MLRPRLGSDDRRASIVAAAKTVFAKLGFDGARLQHIAAAAGISEALIYRHFESKTSLYRAVLRSLIEDQDRVFAAIGELQPSTAGLVRMLHSVFELAMRGADAPNAEGLRILLLSLAGDSSHARLAFRRAMRHTRPALAAALAAARESGDVSGAGVDAANAVAFVGQMMIMVQVSRMPPRSTIGYAGDRSALVRQAVWFCGRGLGLTDVALGAHYPHEPSLPK